MGVDKKDGFFVRGVQRNPTRTEGAEAEFDDDTGALADASFAGENPDGLPGRSELLEGVRLLVKREDMFHRSLNDGSVLEDWHALLS